MCWKNCLPGMSCQVQAWFSISFQVMSKSKILKIWGFSCLLGTSQYFPHEIHSLWITQFYLNYNHSFKCHQFMWWWRHFLSYLWWDLLMNSRMWKGVGRKSRGTILKKILFPHKSLELMKSGFIFAISCLTTDYIWCLKTW